MNAPTPSTVEQYLDALRSALAGADKALIQDALYDAEEHLRSELAQRAGTDEPTVLADIVASYGAPDEVADAYRSNEATIQKALRTPPPPPRSSVLGRFFGIYADPRAYLSMLYMLLALVTGIVYFVFAVAGLSLSVGLAILIIGVPFFLLFVGTARVLALAEGRLVEAMLGTRMPMLPSAAPTRGSAASRQSEASCIAPRCSASSAAVTMRSTFSSASGVCGAPAARCASSWPSAVSPARNAAIAKVSKCELIVPRPLSSVGSSSTRAMSGSASAGRPSSIRQMMRLISSTASRRELTNPAQRSIPWSMWRSASGQSPS